MKFATKVLLVICLPLAVVLVLSCALIVFAVTSHEQLARITSSEAIVRQSTHCLKELFEKTVTILGGAARGVDFVANPEQLEIKNIEAELPRLEQSVAKHPELAKFADPLHSESLIASSFFKRYSDILIGLARPHNLQEGEARWKALDAAEIELVPICSKVVQTLSQVTTAEVTIRNEELERESQLQTAFNLTLFIFASSGVFASALIAVWCIREVRAAMNSFMSNAAKMAGNEPLLDPLSGNDELSQLDAVFHNVHQAVQYSFKRERDVFEYAADLVCSIDQSGHFQYANPSALRLLGYSSRELLGKSFLDIVAPADCAHADEEFHAASELHTSRSFELKLQRADKSEIDSDWTVFWSDLDSSLFCVVSDVTERKNVERLKQDLMAMIEQDIRGPLAAIDEAIGESASGSTGPVPNGAAVELAICKATVDRLMQLIQDLLQFENLQAELMRFDLVSIRLEPVIERAIKEVKALASSASVVLKFSPEQSSQAIADENRLMQLLVNLLSNAVRYSPAGGLVEVQVQITGGFTEISISDQGPGVPEDLRETIFKPFEQAPDSRISQSGGTGLGLAIATSIVAGHHGEIGIRPGATGGSVFWFTLPREQIATVPLDQSLETF